MNTHYWILEGGSDHLTNRSHSDSTTHTSTTSFLTATFLGCGSHLSGSLSEIEPKFFVTRYCHGRPIYYHRKLIGQKLERLIATLSMRYDRLLLLTIMPKHMVFILINTPHQRTFSCISPRITTVIQVVHFTK